MNIYIVAFDGLGRGYLSLDRQGNLLQGRGNELMPNLRAFMAESAYFSAAKGQVPSFTDPNHTAILTGAYPGTTGVISLGDSFGGLDEYGNPIYIHGDYNMLRYGVNGDRVHTVLSLARGIGPSAAIFGKGWLADYVADTADILITGESYPAYVGAPEEYLIGDPISDDNAATDRDGWNITPPVKTYQLPPTGTAGLYPEQNPNDRWIFETAASVIAHNNPTIMYIQPASIDLAQHHSGAADISSEWTPGGLPDYLWDDTSIYNYHGNREATLDVVYEADAAFGEFIGVIPPGSLVIVTADHGQMTVTYDIIDVEALLSSYGVGIQCYFSGGQNLLLWLSDPDQLNLAEEVLESYQGDRGKPFIVMNQQEMYTGIDVIRGIITKPRETYSEFYAEHWEPGLQKWPDLMLYATLRYQVVSTRPWPPQVGAHGSPGHTQKVPLALRGPGIAPGVYNTGVQLVDVAPTIYTLLGIGIPPWVDGMALPWPS